MRPGVKILAMASVVALMSGCGASGRTSGSETEFPTTINNCGHDVRIERQPQRVIALGPSEVTTLYAAGATKRLVARGDMGNKSASYTPEVKAAVASVPQIASSGEITRESLIGLRPDLVLGAVTESMSAESLNAVGIPMLSLRGNCGSSHAPGSSDGTADFDDVFSDVSRLGNLLGTIAHASASIADMRKRINKVKSSTQLQGKTAAAVIVWQNTLDVYGRPSMAHTQFQTLGIKDVFGDVDNRVFDGNIEAIIARNPDLVMILSFNETAEQAKEKFLRIPGAASLAAVRNNALFVQPYEYSGQGAGAVNGLENMSKNLTKIG